MRVHDPVFDGGSELAERMAEARITVGRPLRPSERRELRREVLQQQRSPRGKARRPDIRARLGAMSPEERDAAEASIKDPKVRAYSARIRAELEAAEEEAEYLVALECEEAALAADEDDEPFDWYTLDAPDRGEPAAEALPWPADFTAEEHRTALDIAAVNAEPYDSDDIAEGYDLEEEA